MVKSLATLLYAVMWKIENIPNELVGLGKEISRKNIECANWFLFALYKVELERNELKKELLGFQAEFRRNIEGSNKIQQKDLKVRNGLRARNKLRAVKHCLSVKIGT